MRNSVIALLLAAAGAYAVSSASPSGALPQLNEQHGIRNLVLKAAGARIGRIEPGKMRIPIFADGVLYEVVVASPGMPRLVPAASQPGR